MKTKNELKPCPRMKNTMNTKIVPADSQEPKGLRLGKVKKAIVKWVTENGYTYIGAGTLNHISYGLGGKTIEEIERSLNKLVERGIIKEHKPGFYSLPDWVRP